MIVMSMYDYSIHITGRHLAEKDTAKWSIFLDACENSHWEGNKQIL